MDLCLFQFGFDDDEFKHSDCDASHWELRPSGMIQRRAENLDAMAMGLCNTWPSSVVLPHDFLVQALGCSCPIEIVFGPRAAAVFFLFDCNGFWIKSIGCVFCLIVIVLGPSAAAF